MSGGPYGRGKAPQRACLKLENWPVEDQELWALAVAPVDPFSDGGGTRISHRPHSNYKTEKGYGRWLTFLMGHHLLDGEVHPAERIKPKYVRAYVQELQSLHNKKNTILSRLQELGDMAKAIAPDEDWTFIARLSSWIRAKPGAPSDKRSRMVGSGQLLNLGFSLMAQSTLLSTPRTSAIAYRDGLMIALLALAPLRRANFVALRIGSELTCGDSDWTVSILGVTTKNHLPIEFDWPKQLLEPLETYLTVHRPILAKLKARWAAPIDNALWVSAHGSPLTQMAFYDTVAKRTKVAFGRSINPHLFRAEAATTLAIHDPDNVRSAAPLLGHSNFTTTERYYQQASGLVASRQYAAEITRLRQAPISSETIP